MDFARVSYAVQESEEVPKPLGFFGEFTLVFKQAYKQAYNDIKNKKYFTSNVVIILLPIFFVLIIGLLVFIPIPEPTLPDIVPPKTEEETETDKKND